LQEAAPNSPAAAASAAVTAIGTSTRQPPPEAGATAAIVLAAASSGAGPASAWSDLQDRVADVTQPAPRVLLQAAPQQAPDRGGVAAGSASHAARS
jgi:hypothetical protein